MGWSSFTAEQLAANVFMALRELRQRLAEGWSDVQSVCFQARRSAPLPVYQSLPHGPADIPGAEEEDDGPQCSDDNSTQTPLKKVFWEMYDVLKDTYGFVCFNQ